MLPAPLLLPHIGSCGRSVEGVVPDAPCSSFAVAVRRVSKERCRGFRKYQGAAAKQNGGASGRDPEFRWCQGLIQEAKPRQLPGQSPRKQGGTRRFRRGLKCRRPSLFLLHHQKAHSLFPRRGAPHKSPAKRVLWGRGNRRSAASGGKSEPVSRKRRDWRTRRGRESQCRDGVQGGNGAV